MAEVFMEHPSDADYESVVEAMADAITRLRTLPRWVKWITFQAQGMGPREETYHFADILMLNDRIRLRKSVPVDLGLVARRARVPREYLSEAGKNSYSLGKVNPRQAARVLDVIFRHYLGIRPHPDEDGDVDLEEDDYAVGAEW